MYILALLLVACKTVKTSDVKEKEEGVFEAYNDFVIAFGSCNKTSIPNQLWDDIINTEPSLWIWGGDNIYADTDDMTKLRTMYQNQNKISNYNVIKNRIPFIGTWDDHDYGLNDGGVEFEAKEGSQNEFLDFLEVAKDSPRRSQKGIYNDHHYETPWGTISVFVLDTRYFRTAISPDTETSKRLKPNAYGEGTILGEKQWAWLTEELNTSSSEFNIIVSSIQVLSRQHGFECWGNFPHEIDRLNEVIADSKAAGVIILSGDRHISEFSKARIEGLDYPLIDFTSSGLTHAYRNFSGEPNDYRVGEVVFTESFGTLSFDLRNKKVRFKMIGDGRKVLGELEQSYK